jgi:hypothetical protein
LCLRQAEGSPPAHGRACGQQEQQERSSCTGLTHYPEGMPEWLNFPDWMKLGFLLIAANLIGFVAIVRSMHDVETSLLRKLSDIETHLKEIRRKLDRQ